MSEPIFRPARCSDVDQLVRLRQEFRLSELDPEARRTRPEYESDCLDFFQRALDNNTARVWVADVEGAIISSVTLLCIGKVPTPHADRRSIGYLTNMYTKPEFRNAGIGARLVREAQAAARESGIELIVVWPSQASSDFYKRLGFEQPHDALIWRAE